MLCVVRRRADGCSGSLPNLPDIKPAEPVFGAGQLSVSLCAGLVAIRALIRRASRQNSAIACCAFDTDQRGRRAARRAPALAQLPSSAVAARGRAVGWVCLQPDRYALRLWRRPASRPSGLRRRAVLPCEGKCVHRRSDALPEVAWRAGLDLNPIDVTIARNGAWLESSGVAVSMMIVSNPPRGHCDAQKILPRLVRATCCTSSRVLAAQRRRCDAGDLHSAARLCVAAGVARAILTRCARKMTRLGSRTNMAVSMDRAKTAGPAVPSFFSAVKW